jgi:hypothetical protein
MDYKDNFIIRKQQGPNSTTLAAQTTFVLKNIWNRNSEEILHFYSFFWQGRIRDAPSRICMLLCKLPSMHTMRTNIILLVYKN